MTLPPLSHKEVFEYLQTGLSPGEAGRVGTFCRKASCSELRKIIQRNKAHVDDLHLVKEEMQHRERQIIFWTLVVAVLTLVAVIVAWLWPRTPREDSFRPLSSSQGLPIAIPLPASTNAP
jgi:hypothetical protein